LEVGIKKQEEEKGKPGLSKVFVGFLLNFYPHLPIVKIGVTINIQVKAGV